MRDRRRELFPYAAYRGEAAPVVGSGPRPTVVSAGLGGGRLPVPRPVLVGVALAIVLLLALLLT